MQTAGSKIPTKLRTLLSTCSPFSIHIFQRVQWWQGQLSHVVTRKRKWLLDTKWYYSYFVTVCIPARLLKTIERLCTTILGVHSGKAWQSNEAVCSGVQLQSVYIGRDSTACQAPMDPAMLAAMMVQALCTTVWRKRRPPKSNSFWSSGKDWELRSLWPLVRSHLQKTVRHGHSYHITSYLLHPIACSGYFEALFI